MQDGLVVAVFKRGPYAALAFLGRRRFGVVERVELGRRRSSDGPSRERRDESRAEENVQDPESLGVVR